MSEVLILTFANMRNNPRKNYEESLKQYNYKYVILGDGVKWKNFMTRIKEYKDYLQNNVAPDALVCFTDCFDVYACGPPNELIEKFKSFNTNIVISTEVLGGGKQCKPVIEWWKRKPKNIKTRNIYVNGGCYLGICKYLIDMFTFMLNSGYDDDQYAIGVFVNKYPELVELDYKSKIIGTITGLDHYNYIKDNMRIKNVETNQYPCFIHTPGTTGDFNFRLDYFGKYLLGDKYLYPLHNYKSNRTLLIIAVIGISFLFISLPIFFILVFGFIIYTRFFGLL